MTNRREYLFYLIGLVNWDDETQERYLRKNGEKSWISARETTIDAAIAKLVGVAKMFQLGYVEEDVWKLHQGDPNE